MRDITHLLGDRYELGALIGRGGMAEVYEGHDLVLGRPVAIKVLAQGAGVDDDFVERFRREARAVARLNNPNIVAVYDSGSDGDRHYIVTELIEGESLAALLAREGRLPVARTIAIANGVCAGLAAAHAAGVVHRDVKPGNVMLTAAGGVKVVDFGIAKAAGIEGTTRTGAVFGSAPYLSPEQARGMPADERSDLYALGCVIYQMLTGSPPFVADTEVATLYKHVHEDPPLPSAIAPASSRLDAVIARCLQKDPSQRFTSAPDLQRALTEVEAPTATLPLPVAEEPDKPALPQHPADSSAVLADPGPTKPHASETGRVGAARSPGPPRWPVAVVAAAVAILLVASLALLVRGDRKPPETAASARRSDRSGQASPSSDPAAGPSSAQEALGNLTSAIDSGLSEGMSSDAADKLREHSDKLREHLREGKTDDVSKDAEEFLKELDDRTTHGEIPPPVAERIRAALDDLLTVVGVEIPPPEEGEG